MRVEYLLSGYNWKIDCGAKNKSLALQDVTPVAPNYSNSKAMTN